MDKALDIGKNMLNKYNQLIIQPNIIANPSVYTFVKNNMMFVIESGPNGIMGHSHELYEVKNAHDDAIISFKMARTYLHEHEDIYYIDSVYKIHTINSQKTINQSSEGALHIHSLKVREVFKDSIRIFSDYRDVRIISTEKYIFEIHIDEGILIEHVHDIVKIDIPDNKQFANAKIAFEFVDSMFHGHEGIFYIEREKDNGTFVIKCDQFDGIADKTTTDNKMHKHDHNIKLVRVTKRKTKKYITHDPVPNHDMNEIYNAARMLLQLT